MTYRHAVEIAAPVRRVFDLLEDPEKQKLWMTGLEETVITMRPAGSDPVGTKFVQRMRGGRGAARFEGEITAYERPRRLALRVGNAAFSAELDYGLEQIDGRTRSVLPPSLGASQANGPPERAVLRLKRGTTPQTPEKSLAV